MKTNKNYSQQTIKERKNSKILLIAAITLILIAIIAVIFALIYKKQSQPNKLSISYKFVKQGIAIFYDKRGKEKCRFDIELADTEEKQKLGLMYRDTLAINQGMLFVYEKPQQMGFWMKNTYIPLDIVFIGADSLVAKTAENLKPFSEESIQPYGDMLYGLEINAGLVKRFNIQAGDRFYWKRD